MYILEITLNTFKNLQIRFNQVLNSIELNENLISTSPYYDDYKSYNYELDFNFEAIQANTTAISQIWGKTAVITGGRVRWRS